MFGNSITVYTPHNCNQTATGGLVLSEGFIGARVKLKMSADD
jgi:hypothetical protein